MLYRLLWTTTKRGSYWNTIISFLQFINYISYVQNSLHEKLFRALALRASAIGNFTCPNDNLVARIILHIVTNISVSLQLHHSIIMEIVDESQT